MTNADVIDLRKAGLDDDNLIAAIQGCGRGHVRPLAGRPQGAARGEGDSNRVITAMRERQ